MAKPQAFKALKDIDDIMKLLTGKRLQDIVPKAIEVFGEDLIKKLMKEAPVAFQANDPYSILEIRPGASDFIVTAAYRAMARKYHPDNLNTGDEAKFKQIQAAYEAITSSKKSV